MSSVHQTPLPDELPELLTRMERQFGMILGRFRISPTDGEDLLQETLLQFLLRRDEILSPDAWIAGTLRKQCLMFWRRRRRTFLDAVDSSLLAELAGGDNARLEQDDLGRDLSRVVGRLPERCRSILKLRYGLGCDHPEVAEKMGYSPTGMRKITNRCLSALTHQMLASGYAEATS